MDEQKFPASRVEYLTMIFMDSLDLDGLTPQQLVDKYLEIEQAVSSRFAEIDSAQYQRL